MHVMPAGGPSAAAKDDDEAMAAISRRSAAAGNTELVEGCMVWLVVFLELIATYVCVRCSICYVLCVGFGGKVNSQRFESKMTV